MNSSRLIKSILDTLLKSRKQHFDSTNVALKSELYFLLKLSFDETITTKIVEAKKDAINASFLINQFGLVSFQCIVYFLNILRTFLL